MSEPEGVSGSSAATPTPIGFTVTNRDGGVVPFSRRRLLDCLRAVAYGDGHGPGHGPRPLKVDPDRVMWKVLAGLTDAIPIADLSQLVIDTAVYMAMEHPDYSVFAGRLALRFFQRGLPSEWATFSALTAGLHAHGMVADDYAAVVAAHASVLNAEVACAGVSVDIFGFETLYKSYLLRVGKVPVETPAAMYMRTAIGIHGSDLAAALETFRALVAQEVSHATPTLFFAGTPLPQMSSCFLMDMAEDSIEGIYKTLADTARVSKYAGGIGLAVHKIRAAGSAIKSTNGVSNGLVPMLGVYSATARYVDQGGGKRKGAIAVYLEPWHADVFAFLELKKNHGLETERARDLSYALWVNDLFMARVQKGGKWSLFCPAEAPGLHLVHGPEFEALYEAYEAQGRARAVIDAETLWRAILVSIIETGYPFILFKDKCNAFSNHRHLGCIQSSNLCTEVVQYSSPEETAVCTLAAVVLDTCVRGGFDGSGSAPSPVFDFEKLTASTKLLVRNLNKVLDKNFSPVASAALSSRRHRALGIGVVGLADVFALMGYAYDGPEALALNKAIFETMYYAAMEQSVDLAVEHGPYPSFPGSPLSEGKFQFDLMGVAVDDSRHDWTGLRARVLVHGARNSLLMAVMPTASTAQILGRQESYEPFFAMAYSRRVLAGDFPVVNKHLVAELEARGLWTPEVRAAIVRSRGSVAELAAIPPEVRARYKTAFEIPHKTILRMAVDRQPFICQAQSLNAHIAEPTHDKLTAMLFYSWLHDLKNGVYYTRRKPLANPIQLAAVGSGDGTGAGASTSSTLSTPEVPEPVCTSCAV